MRVNEIAEIDLSSQQFLLYFYEEIGKFEARREAVVYNQHVGSPPQSKR